MAYYRICEKCGARLDPGEPCSCEDEDMKEYMIRYLDPTDRTVFCRRKARNESEAKHRFLKDYRRCRVLGITEIDAPASVC